MNIVNKKFYHTHQDGINLKALCERNKYVASLKAARNIISSRRGNAILKRRVIIFENALYPFNNGNDAALEFIHAKKRSNQSILLFANSSVDHEENPFYFKNRGSHGNFILKPIAPKFDVFKTTRHREINHGTPRDHDTEFKLLEYLGSLIKETDEGILNLYTKYQPCLSCDYVMVQFVQKYKKVKINVYFAEEYKPKKTGGV